MKAVKVKHFVAVFKLFLLISSVYHCRELFSAHWAGYGAENQMAACLPIRLSEKNLADLIR
jgi:hypothetical protein